MSFVERLRFYIFTFNVKVGICRSVIAAQFETLPCSTNHASSYQSNLAFQCCVTLSVNLQIMGALNPRMIMSFIEQLSSLWRL